MKKIFTLLVLIISACTPKEENSINGYIEGEYVYISPSSSGILEEIYVTKGQDVKIGDRLFSIDTPTLQANVDVAKLSLDKAYSNYINLSKGMRPEEILIILKQKEQAEAILTNSKKELIRSQKLFERNYASKSDLDIKTANHDQAKARVDELSATLKTAMLGARDDEIKIAQSEIDMAKQNIIKAQKKFNDSHPKSKVNGKIEDVYYRLGELVVVGAPVVSILPPENIKVRFFVSQRQLPNFQLKKEISVNCDGCKKSTKAQISFISSTAEFTPPIIYSVESREKLVFMLEAIFDEFAPNLHPGLPVSIILE